MNKPKQTIPHTKNRVYRNLHVRTDQVKTSATNSINKTAVLK